jgi:hypothetical protein
MNTGAVGLSCEGIADKIVLTSNWNFFKNRLNMFRRLIAGTAAHSIMVPGMW